MEQYIHTLIPSNSVFVPKPDQIAEFLEYLVSSFGFRVISARPFQQGIRVAKPSGRVRTGTDPLTGETISIPVHDRIKVENFPEILPLIEGTKQYDVLVSGDWGIANRPLVLATPDAVPFEQDYLCEVGCHLRPTPVSMSCWAAASAPNGSVIPSFGEPCDSSRKTGTFSHPWTGEALEIPDAGCARFWIEFEFGKFLLPVMSNSLELLNRPVVAKAQECFQIAFAQGWRFN